MLANLALNRYHSSAPSCCLLSPQTPRSTIRRRNSPENHPRVTLASKHQHPPEPNSIKVISSLLLQNLPQELTLQLLQRESRRCPQAPPKPLNTTLNSSPPSQHHAVLPPQPTSAPLAQSHWCTLLMNSSVSTTRSRIPISF